LAVRVLEPVNLAAPHAVEGNVGRSHRRPHGFGIGCLEFADHAPPVVGQIGAEPASPVGFEARIEPPGCAMVLFVRERGVERTVDPTPLADSGLTESAE
jgi:hypothetical protein